MTDEAKKLIRPGLASAAFVLAAVMCVGTFMYAARTLPGARARVFLIGMGVSVVLLTAGRRTRSRD